MIECKPRFSMGLAVLVMLLCMAGAPVRVLAGEIQALALCEEEFSWMANNGAQSACLVAANLLSVCNGGSWTVPALPDAQTHYPAPNATTQNGCQCSWAVYNTIQACADCQGDNWTSAMVNWTSWSQGCSSSSLTNSSYFPEDVSIPNTTSIPLWAIMNPTNWTNEQFDPSAAQAIALKELPDITQSNRSPSSIPSVSTLGSSGTSSSSNTGIIAGGAVGGMIGLALLSLISFILIRRLRLRNRVVHIRHHKRSRSSAGAGILLQPRRSNSDGTYGRTGDERKVRIFDPFGAVSPGLTSTSSIPLSLPGSGHIGGIGGGHGIGNRRGGGTITGSDARVGAHRPPLVQMPSSYTSLPLSTMSVEEAQPRPAAAIPSQIGLVALNREASSNTTINSSVPVQTHGRTQNQRQIRAQSQGQGQEQNRGYATHHGHVHTVISSFSSSGPARDREAAREGAISPYVLPPLAGSARNITGSSAAEPMTPAEDAQLRARNGVVPTRSAEASGPVSSSWRGHHLKGSSGSTGSNGGSGQNAGSSQNRKSPPAYYHEPRVFDHLPQATGGFDEDGEFVIGEHRSWLEGDRDGDGTNGDSLFAHPADSSTQALSETTLFAHFGSPRQSKVVSGSPTVVESHHGGIEERWG